MIRPIKVILATGFLGSGKTTFLNQVIASAPPQVKLAVLMNEFAEIGVDAALIERQEEMEVIEVRKGSIFCVCAKKEFITALTHVADRIRPDVLLIEATGVANPADIRKDLALPLFNGRFQFQKQICLVDTVHFEAAYHVYAAVEKQIATSDLFILNKLDIAKPEEIRNIRRLITDHQPAARYIEAVYAKLPIWQLLQTDGPDQPHHSGDPSLESSAEQTPPDQMVSAVYLWTGTQRADLEHCLKELAPAVARAKGFVGLDGRAYLVESVMGQTSISPVGRPVSEISPELRNRIVCISRAGDIEGWECTVSPHLLMRESTHVPVALLEIMPGQC